MNGVARWRGCKKWPCKPLTGPYAGTAGWTASRFGNDRGHRSEHRDAMTTTSARQSERRDELAGLLTGRVRGHCTGPGCRGSLRLPDWVLSQDDSGVFRRCDRARHGGRASASAGGHAGDQPGGAAAAALAGWLPEPLLCAATTTRQSQSSNAQGWAICASLQRMRGVALVTQACCELGVVAGRMRLARTNPASSASC